MDITLYLKETDKRKASITSLMEQAKRTEKALDFAKAEELYIRWETEREALRQYEKTNWVKVSPGTSIKNSDYFQKFPNTPLGDLYIKMGTQKALDYWDKVKRSSDYLTDKAYKRVVDVELAKATEKHRRGYVYKPRKKSSES